MIAYIVRKSGWTKKKCTL